MKRMTLEDVIGWVDDVQEEFQREEDQGIMQQRLDKAAAALAGKDACERLKRSIALRFGMVTNMAVMVERKKRA